MEGGHTPFEAENRPVDLVTTARLAAAWLVSRARLGEERGASLVEYALLVALIAVVCLAALKLLGGGASTALSSGGSAFG